MRSANGYARVGRRAKGVQLLDRIGREQGYHLSSISDSLLAEATGLYRERSDKDWGLTDCISFVLMQQHGVSEALTADQHFAQAGFKALLLEMPTTD